MNIILASKSPRRIQILGEMGYKFKIIPAVGEEVVDVNLSSDKMVEKTARNKALEIVQTHNAGARGCVVIGMDTVVVFNGEVLQKPKSAEDQREMLKKLSANMHEVFTGYCVICVDENGKIAREISGAERSAVLFNALSEKTLEEYVKSGLGLDKAGGYGAQDGFGLVARVEGSLSNVIGFPKELVAQIFKELSVND